MDYIKLSRKLLKWEWYTDINTCRVFIHMLLKANWKDGKFRGTTVPRGSFISSIGNLAEETMLTVREVRTAISHLKSTGEVTSKSTNRYTVFTIKNYSLYQSNGKQTDKQETSKRQPNDNLTTTIEELKKERTKDKDIMCKAEASALFEQLWKIYPCKKGKGQVSDAKKKKLLTVGLNEMTRAIERYKQELDKDHARDFDRKPQNGSTFFNSGYVDYLDDNYSPGEAAKKKPNNKFNNFPQQDYNFDELEKELLSNG